MTGVALKQPSPSAALVSLRNVRILSGNLGSAPRLGQGVTVCNNRNLGEVFVSNHGKQRRRI